MQIEKLINDHLRYAYAVGNRVGRTLDRDERDSVVHLALVESSLVWVQKEEAERGDFKFYLARIVDRMVQGAMTSAKRQASRNSKDGQIARMMYEFAAARERQVDALQQGELAELAEIIRAKGYSVSLERLKATQVGLSDTETSIDLPIYDGDGTFADVVTDSRGWQMDPEAILIAKEESVERNRHRRSPEKEGQLFRAWVEWLPKRQRQVMLAAHVWEEGKKPNFRKMCSKKYGGTHTGDAGLGRTSVEAEQDYMEAVETLRAFARGDFRSASFSEVVRSVPTPLIERFVSTLEDPLEQYVMKIRLLTTYQSKVDKGDGRVYQSKLRPAISTVARVWHKRVGKRLGRDITREEAIDYVSHRFERACRRLAVQVGIAPPEVLN